MQLINDTTLQLCNRSCIINYRLNSWLQEQILQMKRWETKKTKLSRKRTRNCIHLCLKPWKIQLNQLCILTKKQAFYRYITKLRAKRGSLKKKNLGLKIQMRHCKNYFRKVKNNCEKFRNYRKKYYFWRENSNETFCRFFK